MRAENLFLLHESGKYYAEVKRRKTKTRPLDFMKRILWLPWRHFRRIVETGTGLPKANILGKK